jgi:hypothetical protein
MASIDGVNHLAKTLETKLSIQAHFDFGSESSIVHDLLQMTTLFVYTLMLVRKGMASSKTSFNADSFVASASNLSRLIV